MLPGRSIRYPYSYPVPSPHRMFKNSRLDHFLQELLKQLPQRDSIIGANTFYTYSICMYILQTVLSPPVILAGATVAERIRSGQQKNKNRQK
jgi:hypothetical protein